MHSSRSSVVSNFSSPKQYRRQGLTKTDAKSVAYKTLANDQSGFISFIVAISDYCKYAHGKFSHTPRIIQNWFEDGGVVESTFDITDSDGRIASVLITNIGCSLEIFDTTSNSISREPRIRIAHEYDLPIASIAIITKMTGIIGTTERSRVSAFELLVFPVGPDRQHLWLPIDLKTIHRRISTVYEPRIITSTDRHDYHSGAISPSKMIARQQEILSTDEESDSTDDTDDHSASKSDHKPLAEHLASSAFDKPDTVPFRRDSFASHPPPTIANLSSPTGRSTISAGRSTISVGQSDGIRSRLPIFSSPPTGSRLPIFSSPPAGSRLPIFSSPSRDSQFSASSSKVPAESAKVSAESAKLPTGSASNGFFSNTMFQPSPSAPMFPSATFPQGYPTSTPPSFQWAHPPSFFLGYGSAPCSTASVVPCSTASVAPCSTASVAPCSTAFASTSTSTAPAQFPWTSSFFTTPVPAPVPASIPALKVDEIKSVYDKLIKQQLDFTKRQISAKQTMMMPYEAHIASIQQTIETIKHEISQTDGTIAQMLPIAEMLLEKPTGGTLESINRYCADEKRKNNAIFEIQHNREKSAVLVKLLANANLQKIQFEKFISNLTSEIAELTDNLKRLTEFHL
jgi:hypothetical protein